MQADSGGPAATAAYICTAVPGTAVFGTADACSASVGAAGAGLGADNRLNNAGELF